MNELTERLAQVRERIDAAARADGRSPDQVHLLLATKTVDPSRIRQALQAGFRLIGENRVQELVDKADDLAADRPETHLIGHLQSNKVNQVVGRVSCVQSVDSGEIAQKLDRRAGVLAQTLDVLIQVNVSGEVSKSGVAPAAVEEVLAAVAGAPRLRLRGWMTIGLNSPDQEAVRAGYLALRELRDRWLPEHPGADQLSMGMSGDYELAIGAGATIVRLGSAVFGSRAPYPETAR